MVEMIQYNKHNSYHWQSFTWLRCNKHHNYKLRALKHLRNAVSTVLTKSRHDERVPLLSGSWCRPQNHLTMGHFNRGGVISNGVVGTVSLISLNKFLPRDARSARARYCYRKSSVRPSAIRRVFGIRGKLRIFRRRYIVGILTNKANISIHYFVLLIVPYRLSTDSKTRDLEWPFCVKFRFAPVRLELWSLAFEAWLLLNL